MPYQTPLGHLVNLSQISTDDNEVIRRLEMVKGCSLTDAEKKDVGKRLVCARNWLTSGFAPDRILFTMSKDPKAEGDDREYIEALLAILSDIDWNSQAIHDSFYQLAEKKEVKASKIFKAVYRTLLGQGHGPKLGMFLASMKKEDVVDLFKGSFS